MNQTVAPSKQAHAQPLKLATRSCYL